MKKNIYILLLLILGACTGKIKDNAAIKSLPDMPAMHGVLANKNQDENGKAFDKELPLDSLLKPTNNYIISSIPLTTLFSARNNVEINVFGAVAYDLREIHSISSRIEGRIVKLYARFKYQHISKGQKLFDIYSPELVTSQQNLLFLLKNDPTNQSMINAAKQRLLLEGMTLQQLQQLSASGKPILSVGVYSNYSGVVMDASFNQSQSSNQAMPNPNNLIPQNPISEELQIKEGMYLQKGQSVFSIVNSNKVILLLNIFPDQAMFIKKGIAVKIIPETDPEKKINGTIDYIEPSIKAPSTTIQARMYFNNSTNKLPIGSQVTGKMYVTGSSVNWVAASAVVSTGNNTIVFKKVEGGFIAQQVSVGVRTTEKIQIISGLGNKDSIALNGQQLVASESTIKILK